MDINKEITNYIHISKYSRWIESENRRETWKETVDRLYEFWEDKTEPLGFTYEQSKEVADVFDDVENMRIMPSMRSLMTAGKALQRDHAAGFNCAGKSVDHQRVFDEIFYLLMCGCGVGFSVERQYINQMPEVAEDFHDTETTIDVQDSKMGWAKGLKELIALLYNGDIPLWDLSSIRPAGTRLRTFGGRASGPKPLDSLFRYTVSLFTNAMGRRLNSLESHDLICKIADTVIVGSVRRSACISLSNLTDQRMARAKRGEWYLQNPERVLANNSVAYTEKPDLDAFTKEMRNLYQSKAGERGIINKVALRKKAEERGREHDGDYILNPCGEAILRDSGGLCNLTEVIVRSSDTLLDLNRKVRQATILGTFQATLSSFRYLRKIWKTNQEEERLLGVSMTGIMDHPVLSNTNTKTGHCTGFDCQELIDWLDELKQVAIDTNEEWAGYLGIEPSKHISLIKPSGTVSQLCGTSSGIHPRFSPYYFRRFTQDDKDPLTQLMIDQGIPHVLRKEKVIFSFPIKSPEGAVCARDMGAIEQLELWKIYRNHWCDGNPSQTIYYTDDTFLDVQAWVFKNWDIIGGLSFFPLDDYIYDKETQPFLEVTEGEYKEAISTFPSIIEWDRLQDYESEDGTMSEVELACSGVGGCELL